MSEVFEYQINDFTTARVRVNYTEDFIPTDRGKKEVYSIDVKLDYVAVFVEDEEIDVTDKLSDTAIKNIEKEVENQYLETEREEKIYG